jgi:hypothetical protein
MSSLPKSYSRIARAITGYCGTYPPSLPLQPGTVGLIDDGSFVREGDFSQYPDVSPNSYPIIDETSGESTQIWMTKGVSLEKVGAEVAAPANAADAKIKMSFKDADDAVIVCKDPHFRSFSDVRAVKNHVWKLWGEGKWDRQNILVTEVFQVASAWIFIATGGNQTAEVGASAPLALAASPLAILKAVAGSAALNLSTDASRSSSSITELQSTCTPLFKAVRISRTAIFGSKIDYVKGSDPRFEEAWAGDDAPTKK